jgi:hypothetical protein
VSGPGAISTSKPTSTTSWIAIADNPILLFPQTIGITAYAICSGP